MDFTDSLTWEETSATLTGTELQIENRLLQQLSNVRFATIKLLNASSLFAGIAKNFMDREENHFILRNSRAFLRDFSLFFFKCNSGELPGFFREIFYASTVLG